MDVTVDELARRFEQGEALVLLDVRQPNERDFCKISAPSSVTDVHIPMGDVPELWGEVQSSAESRPIIVYCHHGVRSRIVTEWLQSQGMANVINLAGGIDLWSKRIDPSVPLY